MPKQDKAHTACSHCLIKWAMFPKSYHFLDNSSGRIMTRERYTKISIWEEILSSLDKMLHKSTCLTDFLIIFLFSHTDISTFSITKMIFGISRMSLVLITRTNWQIKEEYIILCFITRRLSGDKKSSSSDLDLPE